MDEISVQLIMTAGICFLVCLIVGVIICGEAQQIRAARIAMHSQSMPGLRSSVGERSTLEAQMVSLNHTRQGQTRGYLKRTNSVQVQFEELRQIGFTHRQIDRLITYRAAYRAGYYQPDTLMPGRLEFARWLYQRGKIRG